MSNSTKQSDSIPFPGWPRKEVLPQGENQANALMRIAKEQYRVSVTTKGEPFAVALNGPNIAHMFRGAGGSLRQKLAHAYYQRFDETARSNSLADAMLALEGAGMEATPEDVHLRVARHGDGIVIDIGDNTGRCVIVNPRGWEVHERSPVVFRRTALIESLAIPERGGSVDELRNFFNITDATFPLLLGWAMAALLPDIDHPVLLLSGEQGAGKSTTAQLLAGLLDAGPAKLAAPPRDVDAWTTAAVGTWMVIVDNLSTVPDWFSDALCRAVTGDGRAVRKLYTDGDLHVIEFRRPVVLTGIELNALRGDLGSRLLMIDLLRFEGNGRRSKTEMLTQFAADRPRLFGALLDLFSKVLAHLPEVRLEAMPRLADFTRVLAAMDEANDGATSALESFLKQEGRIADDVIDSDPFAPVVMGFLDRCAGEWVGTSTALLDAIEKPSPLPKSWPTSGRGLSGKLRRLAPAMRDRGYMVEPPDEKNRTVGDRERIWRLKSPTPISPVLLRSEIPFPNPPHLKEDTHEPPADTE